VRVVAPQRVDRLRLRDVAPERGAGGHAVAEKLPVEEGRDVGAEEVDAAASLGEAARVLEHLLTAARVERRCSRLGEGAAVEPQARARRSAASSRGRWSGPPLGRAAQPAAAGQGRGERRGGRSAGGEARGERRVSRRLPRNCLSGECKWMASLPEASRKRLGSVSEVSRRRLGSVSEASWRRLGSVSPAP
jgi:hypothetical protein